MKYFIDTEFLEDGRTIELISIGIVAEDGREFYAEANLSDDLLQRVLEHEWLMENVWPHLSGQTMPVPVIAHDVQKFVTGNDPQFWAYCGAYDWVVLNQLFGPMVNHPTKWPFYCNDITQYGLHMGVNHRHFPEQTTTEHNALSDARWTRDVYLWLEEKDFKLTD